MKERTLSGEIITVCSLCKRVRDGEDSWRREGRDLNNKILNIRWLSHGLCDDCARNIRTSWSGLLANGVNEVNNNLNVRSSTGS